MEWRGWNRIGWRHAGLSNVYRLRGAAVKCIISSTVCCPANWISYSPRPRMGWLIRQSFLFSFHGGKLDCCTLHRCRPHVPHWRL